MGIHICGHWESNPLSLAMLPFSVIRQRITIILYTSEEVYSLEMYESNASNELFYLILTLQH